MTGITPEELYRYDPEVATKRDRSPWEIFATQKPALARFALDTETETVISVAADTRFFSTTEPMFSEIGGASVAITPIAFTPARRASPSMDHSTRGAFIGGTMQCVADWRTDCLDWCYEEVEPDGRYMNQGYLTQWPARYPNMRIIVHPRVNLAPWNLDGHSLRV